MNRAFPSFQRVFRPFAADELRPCAGADQARLSDPIDAQTHRHGDAFQVHADQRVADVDARVGLNLLEQVCRRLLPGGRLVVSCILLDTLARCRAFFEGLGWPAEVMQVQSAQSRPLGRDIFLAAANPVFLLAVDKPGQEEDQG